jgi:hypothetical protein
MPWSRALGALQLLAVGYLALDGPAARAQSAAARAASYDSLSVIRRARGAQRDFERTRRAYLPLDPDDGRGRCDERIGRFCYWYESTPRTPPPEDSAVGRARERLLDQLAAAATSLPGDDWITGQRVRYLAEQGRADSAVATARRCAGTGWWCDALEGFARHAAADYLGADSAFQRALGGMPPEERCAWTDLTPLLGDEAGAYHERPCTERDSLNERIWWLAQPLYSRAGNDVRTEHFARRVMVRLLQRAASPHGIPWGEDEAELTVRYGWPTHWARAPGRPGQFPEAPVLGREPNPSFWFLPAPVLLEPWEDPTAVVWAPTLEHPATRYAPRYARGFASIEWAQLARFQRGDSTLTIAAFDLSSDSVFAAHPATVALAVVREPKELPVVARPDVAGPAGSAVVASGWRPAAVSLEAIGSDTARAARVRVLTPPDPAGIPPVVSDILLFRPGDGSSENLEGVLPRAFRGGEVPGGRIGLYWEVYAPPDSAAPLEIAVVVTRAGKRRGPVFPLGRPECLVRGVATIVFRWREEPGGTPAGPARSIVLDVSSLRRGRYRVGVEVRAAGAPLGCSSRDFDVVPAKLALR